MTTLATANFNDLLPQAPIGKKESRWLADPPTSVPRNISSYGDNIGGVDTRLSAFELVGRSSSGKLVTLFNLSPISVVIGAAGLIQATGVSATGAGGTGYAVNDTFSIGGAGTLATGKVTAVAAGVVTNFTITATGLNYTVSTGNTTSNIIGTGTGLHIDIFTIITDVNDDLMFMVDNIGGSVATVTPGVGDIDGNPTLAVGPNSGVIFYWDVVLQTWRTMPGIATLPGGSNTQVEYNNAGHFGGITGATSDGTNLFVTTQAASDSSTKAASTAFVGTAVSNAITGVNPAVAVSAATAAVLPNTPTYANGTAGVGATLTAGANAALIVDGYTILLGDRILIKNQASAFQNGVYTQTTLGVGGSVAWVLTRATDFNQPANMNSTGAIPVINGTANTETMWVLTSHVTTVGTDALTFTQFTLDPRTIATQIGVQNEVYTYVVDGGAANAYTATLSPAVTSYVAGLEVTFKAANANSGSSTLNVNGLGTKTIQKFISGALANLVANDIIVGQIVTVKYDGTQFQMVGSVVGSTDLSALATKVGVQNESYDYVTDTGAANAYVATLTPAVTAYVAGLEVSFLAANSNTTTSTLNVNGLGTKNIQKMLSGVLSNLTAGDIVAGQIVTVKYDGTQFQMGGSFVGSIDFTALATKVGVQNESYTYILDTGAANAYVATLSPAVTSYVAGLEVSFKAANGNSGASTLNVNALGTKNIQKWSGGSLVALASGDISVGQIMTVKYDGTQFQVISGGGGGSASPLTTKGDLYTYSTVNDRLPIGTNGQFLTVDSTQATGQKWVNEPFDVLFNPNIVLGSGAIYDIAVFVRTVVFPGNFAGAVGHCRINPGSTQTITINKNGSGVGTISITSGGVFTFTSTAGAAQTYNSSDYMSFTAQAGADSGMVLQITLTGTR